MQKKKSIPRKRNRYIKKVFFISLISLGIIIVLSGVAYYLVTVKFKKPLYISPLPTMPFVQSSQSDQSDRKLPELQKELKKNRIDYTKVSKDKDSSYIVTLQNGSSVIFSSQKDISVQITSLQYILSHLTMEGRQFSRLDLRFEKPVIVVK